jgi:hypothetical protein
VQSKSVQHLVRVCCLFGRYIIVCNVVLGREVGKLAFSVSYYLLLDAWSKIISRDVCIGGLGQGNHFFFQNAYYLI